MPVRRTIVDVAVVDGRSELDELSAALRFAARTVAPVDLAAAGPRLDGYRLLERVAATSCAEVFSAWAPMRAAAVVVALLRDGVPESTRPALRSLSQLARLRHRNVATVLDAGMHWGRPFGVFAPLAGRSLDTWLREQSSAAAVLSVYRDVASGLAACRAAGIATGAFSPSSIIVDADGTARIVLPNLHACEATDACAGIGPAVARALSRRPGSSAVQAALERVAPSTVEEWSDALGAVLREAKT
jgi:hypothetical protein